ncbi:uncharacterized protein LOC119694216 [Plutella xylostella]|uniref:uncharacterized protein LOC119694216 n=1 Tax=Plutella xylostella TaxID=51655 RepID=UPI002032FB5A|nr:uncharacterized protein LOC119694216 [Plutella xylostella]
MSKNVKACSSATAEQLFPSEDEREGSVDRKTEKKRAGKSMPSLMGEPSSKKRKTTTINPVPAVEKSTARDLFGSDSDDEEFEETKKPVQSKEEGTNHMNNRSIKCNDCGIIILKSRYHNHLRTNIHKANSNIKTSIPNVNIIATAFKNRIMSYHVNPSNKSDYLTPEAFLLDIKSDVQKLIEMSILEHNCIRLNFELFAYFTLPKTNKEELKTFITKFEIVQEGTCLSDFYENLTETFIQKLSEFEHCESGWTFSKISHLEINVNKYSPFKGGCYISLPSVVVNTKSCLNIKNNDDYCFLWSIVAALYPAKRNVCRKTSYPHFTKVLNINDLSFPLSQKDIINFEKNNPELSINVYGFDFDENIVTGPLYLTKLKKFKHINLLYIQNKNKTKGHYCLIKNLLKLVRGQITSHKGKMYLCDGCLQTFVSESRFKTHFCSKTVTILPPKNSTLEFNNYEKKQKLNFIIYADFECLLLNCKEKETNNTFMFKNHQPSCFGYYICCTHDKSLNKYVSYRGEDCVKVFMKKLTNDVIRIHKLLGDYKKMKPLTENQEIEFQNAINCHICDNLLLDDKVHDHDHVTGEFRGVAHSYCNLLLKQAFFIPIVFHNLSGYDSHLFVTELAKYNGPIKIIPKSKEKYLTITKELPGKIQMKFIDSFQFLNSSLDTLSKSLSDNDFVFLNSEFKNDIQFNLLRRKGIYPYDYMDSWEKYDELELPPQERFFNSLTMSHLADSEYQHAQQVWKSFNIQSLGDYTELYLKCDVMLLCDIFERFRYLCLQYYKLDPAHYLTSPGLSWDAMLLHTKVKLELISDSNMYEMIEKGIRGGLAQCSLRHAKANNMYVPDFDDTKSLSYLVYLDCNNLYGHAMCQAMPVSNFQFIPSNQIQDFDVMQIKDNSAFGFILEVDLEYSEDLHDYHSDLPFAPEKFVPIGGKTKKLVANLYNKFNYVIHYVYLQECIKNGLILKKIHKILKFRQEKYLKQYIDLNTKLRQASKTTFEKDFFKLMNNSVFGKTIENKRKHVNIKLVRTWRDCANTTNKEFGAEKLVAKPNLINVSIISENLITVQLGKEKIILDKPIYIGFSVLEYARQHLYKFHYSFIKKYYDSKAKLCYTDTDSLLYLIETENFYNDLKKYIDMFDTSNFSSNNPFNIDQVNEKVPGLFKDELGGEVISEFVGLRAKLYCITSNKAQIMKAKGISKAVTKKLHINNYKDTLFKNITLRSNMNVIKSMKHVLYSQNICKLVLSRNDDKRQILNDQIKTVPWGHYFNNL